MALIPYSMPVRELIWRGPVGYRSTDIRLRLQYTGADRAVHDSAWHWRLDSSAIAPRTLVASSYVLLVATGLPRHPLVVITGVHLVWRRKSEYVNFVPAMPVRSCRVTIKDMEGVNHTVEVTAETLCEMARDNGNTYPIMDPPSEIAAAELPLRISASSL